MDKLARKRSPDPKQEALREKKDQWNSHTSDLIDDLIALKRGINGRGDKDKNLPPSSIKESFPPQIGAYLQEVANSAAKVIQEAKGIVQQQQEYSQTRRRRKKTSKQEAELIKLAELISEASWWGSRMYSRFISLRNVPVRQRNQIVDMMYALADIKDKLKIFEDNLLKFGRTGIADSFTNLNSLVHDYAANVLKPAKKLQNILFEIPESEKFQKDIDSKKIPLEKSDVPPESTDQEKKHEQEIQSAIDILVNDFEYLKNIRAYIQDSEGFFVKPDYGSMQQDFKINYDKYEQFENFFTSLLGERVTSPRTMQNFKNFSLLHRQIIKLLFSLSFRGFLNNGRLVDLEKFKPSNEPVSLELLFNESDKNPIIDDVTFETFLSKLPLQEMNKIRKEEQEDNDDLDVLDSSYEEIFEKNASILSLRPDVKAKILGINPDSFNIGQINSFKISKKSREEINKLLDMLESPTTTIPDILKKINEVSSLLKELSENVLDLGKSYKLYLRRTTKSKDSYLSDIKSEDLYSLRDAANQLFTALKFDPPKPEQFNDPTE